MGDGILNFFRSKYVDDNEINQIEPYPIALCTPMYNSTPFLDRYLQSITSLDYPRHMMSLYFTVQGNDKTYDIMKDFESGFRGEYKKIRVKRIEQSLAKKIPQIHNVVHCRNLLVNWSDPNPVFFIDHDNFPPPMTIRRLQQSLEIGASMAAGVYVFYKRDKMNPDLEGMINFTAFFLENNSMGSLGLSNRGMEGILPAEIFSKRMWTDAVAMGSTFIKRELLNKYRFFVPDTANMSDDTAYCMKVREGGHKFIADFGLLIPHWGYDISTTPLNNNLVRLKVALSERMSRRRRKMHEDGVYIR